MASNNNNNSPLRGFNNKLSATTLRGLNKPKCIKCGNVARSRCPFQSCKNCCAKAENPCHIHVLKANATPDKIPTPSTTSSEQQSTEASPSGATHRIASLRQLSNSFAQFNNLQSPLSSRRPVTKKEAAVVNEWRFQKVKEYKEGVIEQENEAFDRYMQNISLLEEVLAVDDTNLEVLTHDVSPKPDSDATPTEHSNEMLVSAMRLKQRSNPIRSENLKKRVQTIVDQGLEKLRKIEVSHGGIESDKQNDGILKDERVKFYSAERESMMNDLLDRISKARNEEDLKACLEIKSQLFGRDRVKSPMEIEGAEMSVAEMNEIDIPLQSDYSQPKWFSTGTVDLETLTIIDSRYDTPEGIEQL